MRGGCEIYVVADIIVLGDLGAIEHDQKSLIHVGILHALHGRMDRACSSAETHHRSSERLCIGRRLRGGHDG